MPALPEIEVLKRDLEREIVGRRIKDAEVRSNRNAMKIVKRHGRRKEFQDLLDGAKVEKVDRVGRFLVIELDNAHSLVIDLGDSGLLLKTSGSDEMVTHTHIVISFTIGGQLRIVDPTTNGGVFVIPNEEVETLGEEQGFLIDPLAHQFAWQTFGNLMEERDSSMRSLFADEKFLVGLGDIYTDEVLFTAGIRYDKQSSQLASQDVRRLYRALMETMQEAVKARGTSFGEHPFRDLHGDPGAYQLELKVYGRDGESCRRCRNAIEKIEFDSSYTYYCPQCQM
jgi:formamidopyrimidine-DNA glycosylase